MFCYLKDDEHGIFTEMCTMMQQAVVTLPTVYLFDTRLGGGFTENVALRSSNRQQ